MSVCKCISAQVSESVCWVRQVRDLQSDWLNGCAFLALFNGAMSGVVEMAQVNPSEAETNISRAMRLFQVNHFLGLSALKGL